MKTVLPLLAAMALLGPLSPAGAQGTLTPGTYVTPDGRYSIAVTRTAEGVEVKEPNRTTVYVSRGQPNRFYATLNGTEYGIEVIDERTIASFNVRGRTPLRLREAFVTPATALPADLEFKLPEHALLTTFESYKQKVASDPANVHLHAACGAAALAKATFNRYGYREYARGVVSGVKQLLSNPNGANPCPDAIDAELWK